MIRYLKNRLQRVLFKSLKSKTICVHNGVPQGSHLGPVLFLLFINDLPNHLQFCDILLYADDAKIFLSFDSVEKCELLQKDFDNLSNWCEFNCLNYNVEKCKIMSFCRNNQPIENSYELKDTILERVDNFIDLGIVFDSKINFIRHIDVIVGKANCRLGVIKRWSKEFNDPFNTKTLYVSLVRSILEFGCQVWNPHYECHINKIESVQKQFLLFALSNLNWGNRFILPKYEERLLLLNMNTLIDRRKMLNSTFIFKILIGEIDCFYLLNLINIKCPIKNLRHVSCIYVPYSRLNYLNYEPFSNVCKDFNNFFFLIDYNFNVNLVKTKILNYLKTKL